MTGGGQLVDGVSSSFGIEIGQQADGGPRCLAAGSSAFQQRHGHRMPEDNVWLLQRRAEHTALTKLLDTIRAKPGRAVQGAGCSTDRGTAPTGPVPLTLDLDRHRRTRP